jgi:hypothetical protein
MLIGKQSGTYGIIEELGREGQPVWRAGYGGQRMVGWCDSGHRFKPPLGGAEIGLHFRSKKRVHLLPKTAGNALG